MSDMNEMNKMNEMNNEHIGYEPNFILKPAAHQSAEADPGIEAAAAKAGGVQADTAAEAVNVRDFLAEADAEIAEADKARAESGTENVSEFLAEADAEISKADANHPEDAADAETVREPEAKPYVRESPAAEVLRAAAARADALKAAAAKVDQAGEPYRRETSSIDDPVFAGVSPGADESDAFGGSTPDPGTASSYNAAGATGTPENHSGMGAGRFRGRAAFNQPSYGNPTFENPSFDPGQTGRFRDPREQFRAGESASWSNGEVHRNRRQMKESIRRQKKQKGSSRPVTLTRKATALLIAGCLCLSCLTGLGGAALGMSLMQKDQIPAAQTTAAETTGDNGDLASSAGYTLESATGSHMTIKEITAATKNSVVEIRTESVASDSWMQQYVTQGAGSGVIISEDGYIMTDNHVIEGASKIKVTTADEKEYEAKLVGADETTDVAVLKIDASGLTPVTYGNSDNLEVGDLAVAIGNPLGELGGTVTAGIISATDRELAIDGKTMHLLQTDSSINPGNSGGGLFNGDGQLIGLVEAKSSGSDVEGLGFATPINTAANVAAQLIDKGYVSGQPSTGMTYQEGSSATGGDSFSTFDSLFGGSASTGVYIYSVNGENAKKAGFQPGDQVIAVDGKDITDFESLSAVITAHKVGDKVKFAIVRDGTQKNITLELEEKTAEQSNAAQDQNGQNGQNGQNSQDQMGPGGQNGQAPGNGQNGGQDNSMDNWSQWFNSLF